MTDTEGRGGRGIEQPARDLGHEFVRIKDYPENVHSKCSLKFTLKGGGVEPTGSSIRRSLPPQRARFGGQTGELRHRRENLGDVSWPGDGSSQKRGQEGRAPAKEGDFSFEVRETWVNARMWEEEVR